MMDIPSCSFGSKPKRHFQSELNFPTFFNKSFPLPCQNSWTLCQPTSTIATRVISVLRMKPFTLEDWRQLPVVGKNIGTTGRLTQSLWEWTLTLQDTPFSKRVRLLSGFTARVRKGYYGYGNQVKNCTVSSTITVVGQTIALACNSNPTKVIGLERLLPCIQIMLDGYQKVNPPTRKKAPSASGCPRTLG
jgi:hypothetical protein